MNSHKTLKPETKIGFFSYGSGAVSEIFSGHGWGATKGLLRTDRLDTFVSVNN